MNTIILFFIFASVAATIFFIVRLYKSTEERVFMYFPKLDFSILREEVRKNSIAFIIGYVVLNLSFGAFYLNN